MHTLPLSWLWQALAGRSEGRPLVVVADAGGGLRIGWQRAGVAGQMVLVESLGLGSVLDQMDGSPLDSG
ncbi:MAG TPA: hypothetical protein PKO09_17860 [Anaerolineae bacterium]|nr:hypothetical protein [Anaerolineae bacterium]